MSDTESNCLIIHHLCQPSAHLGEFLSELSTHNIQAEVSSLKEFKAHSACETSAPQLVILWQYEFSQESVSYLLQSYFSELAGLHRIICIIESHPVNTKDHLELAKLGVAVIYPVHKDNLDLAEIVSSVVASFNSIQNWCSAIEKDRQESRRLIMNIMRQNSEMGLVSQFLQECNSHQNAEKIGYEFVSTLNQLGLESVCEIRMRSRHFVSATEGRKPTLTEMQIIQAGRNQDRIVTSHRLAVINYPNITLLIKNMPIYDEDRYGHCKDLVVQLGDIAQTRVRSISVETAANERSAIIELVQQKASDNIRHMHIIMKRLLVDAETSLSFLGCTEEQEKVIFELIENARAQLDSLHDSNALLDDHLAGVMLNFSETENAQREINMN